MNITICQINNSFSGQNYFPYSSLVLEEYVRKYSKYANRITFGAPPYKRESVEEIVKKCENSDLVGFSLYVWNEKISLAVARRLRQIRGDGVKIVFGGPQVPNSGEDFLRRHPFIDVLVHGEGEVTFTDLVDCLVSGGDLRDVSGISFMRENRYTANRARERIKDFQLVPSAYLGVGMKRLMMAFPDERWIALWETNRGCPFSCTFCDWGSATAAKVTKFDMDRIYAELNWMADNKIEYIFVCDANFGILPRDKDIANHVASLKVKTGYPQGFSVQNTKNATERAFDTQMVIAKSGLNRGVALSMQSLDEETLANIKRANISNETYFELARRFSQEGVET